MSEEERVLVSRRRDILAISLLATAILCLVSLHTTAAGVVGGFLSDFLRWSVGQAADLPPLLCALGALAVLRAPRGRGRKRKVLALLILFAVLVAMLQIMYENQPGTELVQVLPPPTVGTGGGALGTVIAHALLQAFGLLGSGVVLIALALISAVLFADTPVAYLAERLIAGIVNVFRVLGTGLIRRVTSLLGAVQDVFRNWRDSQVIRRAKREPLRRGWLIRLLGRRYRDVPVAASAEPKEITVEKRTEVEKPPRESSRPEKGPPVLVSRRRSGRESKRTPPEGTAAAQGIPLEPPNAQTPAELPEVFYQLPPIALFERPKARKRSLQQSDQRVQLEETLATFGVEAAVVSVSRGPVVTRYELQPAPGVSVKRITGLADDLALNLAAAGVRIEAPVPGKSVVGIEVPNKETTLVTFREVADSEAFAKSRSRLAIALGTDIAGNPVIGDLTRWLHLLIAGATGSGKSVCINTIIGSILVKARPHEVKLLLIDPKRVELAVYDGVPHLIAPVVTDPKQASVALRWAVREMESRFKQFADLGVRNIDGYNRRVLQEETGVEPLPHIVVIIDELADLMMVARAEVEDSICRLAQMARAAGMYLIVATQRPSVDVITGLIKANVPSRISFAVSSGMDSRVILDHVGAERLLGKGDMLFHPIGMPKPIRAQGAFISDKEVASLVDFWKVQGTPEYQETVLTEPAAEEVARVDESDDELFGDACRLVAETGTASISMLQRRFRVGYARAARLIDMMELRGIVGPYQGSKPREVLRTADEIEEMVL